MSDKAIVKYEPAAPLQSVNALWRIRDDTSGPWRHLQNTLNHAWPGDDLDPQLRAHKTIKLLKEAEVAIMGSERPQSLLQCSFESIVDSLATFAGLDLTLRKAFGEAYLVPFKGVCTPMIGYRGFIKLLVNTGFVTHIESVLVYQGEEFSFTRDETGPRWTHKPDLDLQGQADQVKGCYAVGYTRGGAAPIFEYMNAAELEKVKQSSAGVRSGKPTPYSYWATEMMRKATIRRMAKYIPKVAENQGYALLAKAVEVDNQGFDLPAYAATVEEFKQKKLASVNADIQARAAGRLVPDDFEPQEPPEPPEDPDDEIPFGNPDAGEDVPPGEADEFGHIRKEGEPY